MSFFLGSKNKDLSDKSRNGGASKKLIENSDNVGSLTDDVFSDNFNSPECAKVLVNYLKV